MTGAAPDRGATPLEAVLHEVIAAEGPIGVDRFMALALTHPAHGYYMRADPFGPGGDFVTAPEISQMFGELLGLWAAATWIAAGRPDPVRLVELGPGRGTLMSDALRAARSVPGFGAALRVHLVEASPALQAQQETTLAGSGVPVDWHPAIADVPAGFAIILGNEFLDALPIRQFVRTPTGWHERLVGMADDGALAFGLAPAPVPELASTAGPDGAVVEVPSAALASVRVLAARLARDGGAVLLIDYGAAEGREGDTLQAVREHRFVEPLSAPGECDLTAHVRFGALARAARDAGAVVHGPVTQAEFLEALGIRERAERLRAAAADAAASDAVAAALGRLTDRNPTGMGALFKVMGLSGPDLPALPGLPAAMTGAPGSEPTRNADLLC